jgi:hypothetical protein
MATFAQEKEQRDALTRLLVELAAIDPQSLVRSDQLGQVLSFEEGLPYFERALKLFRDLLDANLDIIPFTRLQHLVGIAQDARNRFTQVQQFSLQQHPNNPAQARDSILASIRDQYDSWFDHASPIISYSVRKGTDFEKLEQEARNAAGRAAQVVGELTAQKKLAQSEAEAVMAQVRRAAQEVGVAQHAVHFKNEADIHEKGAKQWLGVVAVLAAVTIAFALANVLYYGFWAHEIGLTRAIQLSIAKVLFFSILLTALVWSGRIYRAHRHNAVVNKHRQNALSSFETFAKAAGDDQTKSAVLLQTTSCIFAPQPSAYTDSSGEGSPQPQFLEIVRTVPTPGDA